MALKTEQRAKKILQVLLRHGNASVEDLVSMTGVSAPSIRRDLVRLEQRNLVHRTHGGARLAAQMEYQAFRFDSSFQVRESRFAEEKRRIGMAAAELIREHDTVGFTAGTTTTQVARCIRHRSSIHVITNAVNIAMELSNQPALNVTLTGGTMRWAGAFSLTGPISIEMLNGVFLDKVFIGACGVDPKRGVTTIEPDEAAVFRAMVRQAKQVVVVADSSKISMISPALICRPEEIDILVTDGGITAEALEAFCTRDVEVKAV
ncbi:MAG TPA: DeoR/GlpR family DNA-binding transcription regulator [Acidobacteriaceae bacterium]|jgi:DeoR family transcriptional regulator of aga operon|nr:DeoR/GlpR family DNA-binding transcription regulator [Acidobacteriaceae bacterium]